MNNDFFQNVKYLYEIFFSGTCTCTHMYIIKNRGTIQSIHIKLINLVFIFDLQFKYINIYTH